MLSFFGHFYVEYQHGSCLNYCALTQDEIEAARMAAINKKIKRVLTEVLSKVLFLT